MNKNEICDMVEKLKKMMEEDIEEWKRSTISYTADVIKDVVDEIEEANSIREVLDSLDDLAWAFDGISERYLERETIDLFMDIEARIKEFAEKRIREIVEGKKNA